MPYIASENKNPDIDFNQLLCEKTKLYNQIIEKSVDLGYTLIKAGNVEFYKWRDAWLDKVGNMFAKAGFSNANVEQIIEETWKEYSYQTQYGLYTTLESIAHCIYLGGIHGEKIKHDLKYEPIPEDFDVYLERIIIYQQYDMLVKVATGFHKTNLELRDNLEQYYQTMHKRIEEDTTRSENERIIALADLETIWEPMQQSLRGFAPKYPKLKDIDLDKIPSGHSVCFEMDGKIVNYTPNPKSEEDQPIKQSKENKYTFKDFVLDSIDPNPNTEPKPIKDNFLWNTTTMVIVWLRIMIGVIAVMWVISCFAKGCREIAWDDERGWFEDGPL